PPSSSPSARATSGPTSAIARSSGPAPSSPPPPSSAPSNSQSEAGNLPRPNQVPNEAARERWGSQERGRWTEWRNGGGEAWQAHSLLPSFHSSALPLCPNNIATSPRSPPLPCPKPDKQHRGA